MPDVFISYSRKDKAFVRLLFEALEKEGRDTWVDWDDIPPSVDWMKEIYDGIENADFFIFVITPDSVNSKICFAELEHAETHNKRLVPLLHREVQVHSKRSSGGISPEAINPLERAYSALGFDTDAERLMARLSPHNWIFFREEDDFDQAFRSLIETISSDLDYTREHTRLLIRAREWESRDRDHSFLLTDVAIGEAEHWLEQGATKEPKPTELHHAYINASRLRQLQEKQHEMRLEKQAANRLRYLAVALALFSVAAVVLSIFALSQRNAAIDARATSDANLEFAREAGATAQRRAEEAESFVLSERIKVIQQNGNALLGLALALEANSIDNPVPAAQYALSQVAYTAPRRLFATPDHNPLTAVQVSPDGNILLIGSSIGELVVWDTARPMRPIHNLGYHTDTVLSIAFSPDGQTALTSAADQTFALWDVRSGQRIQEFSGFEGNVFSVGFSADSKTALAASCSEADRASVSCEPQLSTWDTRNGERLHTFAFHDTPIDKLIFSPDGTSALISTGTNNELILWNIAEDQEIYRTPVFDTITAMRFSRDGQQFVTGHLGNSVSIWDTADGNETDTYFLFGGAITSVDLKPDNTGLLVGYSDGVVNEILFAVEDSTVLFGHTDAVSDVLYLPDGQRLLSTSADGNALMWDTESGAILLHIHETAENWILGAVLVGERAVVLTVDNNVETWDITSGEQISSIHLPLAITQATFSPDGKRLLLVSESSKVHVWDIETNQEVFTLSGDPLTFAQLVYSPDGSTILAELWSDHMLLLDASTGEEIQRFEFDNQFPVSLAISPNGDYALSGNLDRSVTVWDIASGEARNTFRTFAQTPYQISISPDSSELLISSGDSQITLWDIDGSVRYRFDGHTDDVTRIVFSPDGNTALSSSLDGTIIVWQTNSGSALRILERQTAGINGLSLNADGKTALSWGENDGLIVWRIDSLDELVDWTCQNRAVRNLTDAERVTYNITAEHPICPDILPQQQPPPPPR